MIIFSRACGYFVIVCSTICIMGLNECDVSMFGVCVSVNMSDVCYFPQLSGGLDAIQYKTVYLVEQISCKLICVCLSIDHITWLVENANQKLASISRWGWNRVHVVVFMEIGLWFLIDWFFSTLLFLNF